MGEIVVTDEDKIGQRQSPEFGVERGQLFRPVPFFLGQRRGPNAVKKLSQACEVFSPEHMKVNEVGNVLPTFST
jgi:hypothetical protein